MTKLIALTDIHLRPRGETIIGVNPATRLAEALADIATRHNDAKGVIMMGDLANSGTVAEYALLAEITEGFALPVTYMMGNHDQRDHFCEVMGRDGLDESGFLQSVQRFGDHTVLTLDTLYGPPFVDFAHFGQLCDARLGWIEAQLNAATGPVHIFMHHPAWDVGFAGMDMIKLDKPARFRSLLDGAAAPVHLYAGHVHRTISGRWGRHGYSMFKSTCHQMPLDFVSTDSSLSIAEPGAYGIIMLQDDGVAVHSEDFTLTGLEARPTKEAMPDI